VSGVPVKAKLAMPIALAHYFRTAGRFHTATAGA